MKVSIIEKMRAKKGGTGKRIIAVFLCAAMMLTTSAMSLSAATMTDEGVPENGASVSQTDAPQEPEQSAPQEPEQSAPQEPEQPQENIATESADPHPTIEVSTDKTELMTGEAATTTIRISNPDGTTIDPDDGMVVRLYMQFAKTPTADGKPNSADGEPTQREGKYTIKAEASQREYEYTVTRIPGENDDHYTYCFEIQRPLQGDTITLSLPSSYPSSSSAGGTNTIWGAVLTKAEKNKLDESAEGDLPGIVEKPADAETVTWTTQPDTFQVEKSSDTSAHISGDGQGNSYIRSLSYTFATSRTTEVTQEGNGKDYVTEIHATDTFTLPDGVSFSDEIKEALKSGFQRKYNNATAITMDGQMFGYGDWYQTKDGTDILALYDKDKLFNKKKGIPVADSISLSGDGKTLTVTWTLKNATAKDGAAPTTEIGGAKLGLVFGDKVLKLDDPDSEAGTKYTLKNQVHYTWQYSWSGDQEGSAECESDVAVGEAVLELKKTSGTPRPNWYGDPRSYVITAENTGGLPYNKLSYVTDTLPDKLYLRAEDIHSLLDDDKWGKKVTITISDAVICRTETREVKDITGAQAGKTSVRNTSAYVGNKYIGMSTSTEHQEVFENNNNTIVIRRGADGKITITLNPDSADRVERSLPEDASSADIQSALDELNFLVTSKVRYTLRWDRTDADGKPEPLQAGQKLTWNLPCAVKDTFMLLDADVKYTHPEEKYAIEANTAYAYGPRQEGAEQDELLASAKSGSVDVKREFTLSKGAKLKNGAEMDEANAPGAGEIIDYSLHVTHKGKASYDLLPLTDHMTGAQVLLAEQDKNKDADWAQNCATVLVDGVTYYTLKPYHTYTGVWLNGSYADTVAVSGVEGNYDTLIKWYFQNYSGEREDTVSYKAMVQLPEAGPGTTISYDLNNESWLNDHQTHRLYAPVGTTGSYLDFDKKIVSKADMDAAYDAKEEGKTQSAISEGETVYYRLKISAVSNEDVMLTGLQMSDVLPLALKDKSIQWRQGTADAASAQPGDVWIEAYQNAKTISSRDGDGWRIEDTETADTQSIQWSDDFYVTFGSDKPLYIYVRLTFPKEAGWQEYAAQYGTTTLTNTFYLDGVPKTVTHTLGLQAQAYLQKGVYSTEAIDRANKADKDIRDTDTDSLWHYTNDDAYHRGVVYYALVYNDGQTRLYLQDLQDVLPQGFTYKSLIDGSLLGNTEVQSKYYEGKHSIGSSTSSDLIVAPPEWGTVKWMDATVTAKVTNDLRRVDFQLTAGTNAFREDIHYDETRKMYYLNPGEGVKFLYLCATNEAKDTLDAAENSIAMPFYDFNHGGLAVSQTPFTRVKQDFRDKNWYHTNYTPNDGSCSVIDNTQAVTSGRTSAGNDVQWLYSQVRQTRGEIKPGVTKELTAAISTTTGGNQTVKEYPAAAHSSDTLRWTVTAANDGTAPILDYALTDTMQSPYVFDGNVDYAICNSAGEVVLQAENGKLFHITAPDEKNQVKVEWYYYLNSPSTSTLTVNGDAVKIKAKLENANRKGVSTKVETLWVRLTQDEKGNYSLSVRFSDSSCGIPAGGTGRLTVHTKRPDTTLENKVFVNTCFLTPMDQTWDNTTNKGNMTTLDNVFGENDKPTVRNSAPVTTAYGYVTSSLKSVEETTNPSNKATCNQTPNYIVLPGKDSLFSYTLNVDAPDDQAMDKLILIDGLPEVNDHSAFQTDDPRFSEFKVAFADTPNVTVTVQAADGTVTTLTSEQYKVEYSAKTSFDADDWKGTSAWNENSTDARSLRIQILDGSGTVIPAKSHVFIRFDAKISGDAKPGQIAWNSFGYHYSVVSDPNELEAAPLKVGVMLPAAPGLTKKLVDSDGNATQALKDETFRFLLYTGTSLDMNDEAKLGEALTKDSREASLLTLTVEKGHSASEALSLTGLKVWSYNANGGWIQGSENWTWKNNQQYTLAELPDDNGLYDFYNINNRENTENGYTFTYMQDKTLTLTAVNQADTWAFTITKTDAEDSSKCLSGAWFALYSSESADQMAEDAYQKLTEKPEKTLTQEGRTWYLCRVEQTGENGTLTWSGLLRDEYIYREFKAPQGYKLDGTIRTAKKADTTHSVSITNAKAGGPILPETGGIGTLPYTLGGILLLAAGLSCAVFGWKGRRREGDR